MGFSGICWWIGLYDPRRNCAGAVTEPRPEYECWPGVHLRLPGALAGFRGVRLGEEEPLLHRVADGQERDFSEDLGGQGGRDSASRAEISAKLAASSTSTRLK